MTCVTRYVWLHVPTMLCQLLSNVWYMMLSLFIQLYEKYLDFVTSEDKETLMAKLQEVEDWLYEDGEDETKGVYLAKLEDLKKVCFGYCTIWSRACFICLGSGWLNFLLLQIGGPIELRYRESEERGPALEQLLYCIRSFREAALSSDQKFDHIDIGEKQKVFTRHE